MAKHDWIIQIFELTDDGALASAAELLSSTQKFIIDARGFENRSLLTVECADPSQALTVYELVMMADHEAELIYSTTGASIIHRLSTVTA